MCAERSADATKAAAQPIDGPVALCTPGIIRGSYLSSVARAPNPVFLFVEISPQRCIPYHPVTLTTFCLREYIICDSRFALHYSTLHCHLNICQLIVRRNSPIVKPHHNYFSFCYSLSLYLLSLFVAI